jgi:hypothetical protein
MARISTENSSPVFLACCKVPGAQAGEGVKKLEKRNETVQIRQENEW